MAKTTQCAKTNKNRSVKKENLYKCRRKGCNFTTEMKGLMIRHRKSTCAFIRRRTSFKSKTKKFGNVDFSKTKIIEKLGEGGFGKVYLGKIGSLTIVIKAIREKESAKREIEVYRKVHKNKRNPLFPDFYGSFNIGKHTCLAVEKLDITLSSLGKSKDLKKKQICDVVIHVIRQLEELHNKGFVHRDLKANNIMLKGGKAYVIDFGTCVTYQIGTEEVKGSVYGDILYMSFNSHSFNVQRPKDDLETIGYILMEFINGWLPWIELCFRYRWREIGLHEAMEEVAKMKEDISSFNTLPEMEDFFRHVRALKGSEKPSYEHLIGLVEKICVKCGDDQIGRITESKQKKEKINKLIDEVIVETPSPVNCEFQYEEFNIGVPEWSLPSDLLRKYIRKEKIEKNIIIAELGKYSYFESTHFFCFDLINDANMLKRMILANMRPMCWLCRRFIEIEGSHYFVWISYEGKVITFDGVEKDETKIEGVKIRRSNKWKQQDDNWTSGYWAFTHLLMINNFGIERWVSEVEKI